MIFLLLGRELWNGRGVQLVKQMKKEGFNLFFSISDGGDE